MQWIEAFSRDIMLIKRPIIVKNHLAVLVGFRAKEDELIQKLEIETIAKLTEKPAN